MSNNVVDLQYDVDNGVYRYRSFEIESYSHVGYESDYVYVLHEYIISRRGRHIKTLDSMAEAIYYIDNEVDGE